MQDLHRDAVRTTPSDTPSDADDLHPLDRQMRLLRSGRVVDTSHVPLSSRVARARARVGRPPPRHLGWWRRGRVRPYPPTLPVRAEMTAQEWFLRVEVPRIQHETRQGLRPSHGEQDAPSPPSDDEADYAPRRARAMEDALRAEAAIRRDEERYARQERQELLDEAEANAYDHYAAPFEDAGDLNEDAPRRLVPALPDPHGFCQPTEELRLGTCAICQDENAPRSVVFQACGHVSTCVKCSFELVKRTCGDYSPDGLAKCPVCRITSIPMQLRVA